MYLMRSEGKGERDGFTLLEIVVTMGILAILLTLLYGSFSGTQVVTRRVEEEADLYRLARIVINRMGVEISGVYCSKENTHTLFRGVDGGERDSLIFTALSPTLARIHYFTERDSTREASFLMRGEEVTLLDLPGPRESIDEVAETVVGFNLRYFDGGTWRDSWEDEREKRVPQALEVTLLLRDKRGVVRDFTGSFPIPLSRTECGA